jgi:5-methylcytosine-specific restriction protein B
VKRKYIDPAKKEGKKTLSIRAGNIHKELGFSRRIPVVCSALRSRKLSKNCDIELTYIGGPNNSTTTTYTYRLNRD